jgi:hypothetical protein
MLAKDQAIIMSRLTALSCASERNIFNKAIESLCSYHCEGLDWQRREKFFCVIDF